MFFLVQPNLNKKQLKSIALQTSIYTLFVSLIIFALFDFSNNQFQFVQKYHGISYFCLEVCYLYICFVLLTSMIIIPILAAKRFGFIGNYNI